MNKHFWMAVLSADDEEAKEMLDMLEVYEQHQEQVQREEDKARILAYLAEFEDAEFREFS